MELMLMILYFVLCSRLAYWFFRDLNICYQLSFFKFIVDKYSLILLYVNIDIRCRLFATAGRSVVAINFIKLDFSVFRFELIEPAKPPERNDIETISAEFSWNSRQCRDIDGCNNAFEASSGTWFNGSITFLGIKSIYIHLSTFR